MKFFLRKFLDSIFFGAGIAFFLTPALVAGAGVIECRLCWLDWRNFYFSLSVLAKGKLVIGKAMYLSFLSFSPSF